MTNHVQCLLALHSKLRTVAHDCGFSALTPGNAGSSMQATYWLLTAEQDHPQHAQLWLTGVRQAAGSPVRPGA